MRLGWPTRRSTAIDRLADLQRAGDGDDDPAPVIFAPNHHSHLDTALMVRAVPAPWRQHLVDGGRRRLLLRQALEGDISAPSPLNAIPIDREVTGRSRPT